MITQLFAVIIYALSATKTMASDFVLGTSAELAVRSISLDRRHDNTFVNSVMRDNILLTLKYMTYNVTLNPGEVFAFHEDVLPEYKEKTIKTTNAHFNYADGFKSDGWLMGDGVCHLASLIYWAARDAGLAAAAPANHDFANIPQVPREYGVSIYFYPGRPEANARQNLYITNTFEKPVSFVFAYDGDNLTVKVID